MYVDLNNDKYFSINKPIDCNNYQTLHGFNTNKSHSSEGDSSKVKGQRCNCKEKSVL